MAEILFFGVIQFHHAAFRDMTAIDRNENGIFA
jgi:hypothetical protein